MDDHGHREWLLRRLEIEARAYANSRGVMHDIRWGRVLAYVEVGVHFGFWTPRAGQRISDAVEHRYQVGRIRRIANRR